MEHWLAQWSKMMISARNVQDFPLWLQYFSKIIFLVINTSGELLDVQVFLAHKVLEVNSCRKGKG
jgi:hypothetical protein